MNASPRRAIRFPPQVESVEVVARVTARVVDESHTGIALAIDSPPMLALGQVVAINYGGAEMPAIVRRLENRADGSQVIGLQWQYAAE